MAAQESAAAAADSSGPRFAPDDPTLPAPWKALIDGATLYYWNPETNVTQYEKPAAAAGVPPLPAGPPPATSAQVPEPAPGAYSQPNAQFGQAGQAGHLERPGQAGYHPQAGQLGQQQQHTQQPAQQPPFQQHVVGQHQASFQQVTYQQQQPHMPNQPHQYHGTHPQHMPYQHGPYMQQPQHQQQTQPYAYQADQQPQVPQSAYNQAQQPPMPQAAYNQGQSQQPPMPQVAYNQGQSQQPPMPQAAYNQGQVQQPPMPQPSYNQGQQSMLPQSAYNQAQQPQIPHGAYNQSQQPQGVRLPQNQGQHPQQSMSFHHPAQASQSLHVSQPQGLKMPSQQGQLQHGLPFTQHGKLPLSHGQQSPLLKDDDGVVHEVKQTGFSLPLSQQHGQAPLPNQQLPSSHQHPGALSSQPNIPGVGGPLYPAKHLPGGSPAQMHQGGADTNYQQKPVSGHAVPNHVGPSPIRPPMAFDMGNSDGHFERDDPHSYGRFDGTKALQQQPKLAPLPNLQNPLGMHNGPSYPRPDNFGGYNMAPPHSVPNPHNLGPLSIGTSVRPPSSMFAPPDFPGISSADAYRQHHEVTAMGENVPAPFMTFEATGFPPEILREIIKCG